jgi:DNA-directed RNA polymerase alpha subunit
LTESKKLERGRRKMFKIYEALDEIKKITESGRICLLTNDLVKATKKLDKERKKFVKSRYAFKSISEINFSEGTRKEFTKNHHLRIILIGDLLAYTATEILSSKCFGRRSFEDIKKVLKNNGLSFGMLPKDWKINN